MSDPFDEKPLPRGVLIAAGSLVLATLILVATLRIGGFQPASAPGGATLAAREFRFEDRPDGSVAVLAAGDNRQVARLAPGTDGFVRATLRGLARERKRQNIGSEPAFRLTAWADGRLTLFDPATHRRVDLESFGPTNAQAFARLLSAEHVPDARTAAINAFAAPGD